MAKYMAQMRGEGPAIVEGTASDVEKQVKVIEGESSDK